MSVKKSQLHWSDPNKHILFPCTDSFRGSPSTLWVLSLQTLTPTKFHLAQRQSCWRTKLLGAASRNTHLCKVIAARLVGETHDLLYLLTRSTGKTGAKLNFVYNFITNANVWVFFFKLLLNCCITLEMLLQLWGLVINWQITCVKVNTCSAEFPQSRIGSR